MQTAPEKKMEVSAGPPRTDADDDIRFLESTAPDHPQSQDPLSTSARAERLKQKEGDVAFFSRYKNDEILLEPSAPLQVGANKWVMQPPVWIRFNDRVYTTGDQKIIKFLRNHARYGIEILEFGVKAHEVRIKLYDDSGRISNIDRLSKLAKASEQRWRAGVDDG